MKEGNIKGKIQQGGIYVPESFTKMQESTLKSFYSQNKYIEFSMLSKLQISKPKEFIEQVIGKDKGKCLTNFFVSHEFLAMAEA